MCDILLFFLFLFFIFLFFIFLIFLCVLVGAIVCVYVCIQLYCSCCHYGVIKHDDDDDSYYARLAGTRMRSIG